MAQSAPPEVRPDAKYYPVRKAAKSYAKQAQGRSRKDVPFVKKGIVYCAERPNAHECHSKCMQSGWYMGGYVFHEPSEGRIRIFRIFAAPNQFIKKVSHTAPLPTSLWRNVNKLPQNA
ncbi:MAG: hypothetical protein LBF26_00915 [Puniceicoccales bacterium]|jgi:superfamily II DNA helicase RecQ|nr:hypothetical protein [Puniceicoccales bacterium]